MTERFRCCFVLWFFIVLLFLLHSNLVGIGSWILFMIRDVIGFEAVSKNSSAATRMQRHTVINHQSR